jgi:hypothetical protein
MTHDEREPLAREPLGSAPETPAAATDILARCESDRQSMSPRETADCAGVDLAERYENEEDGGS